VKISARQLAWMQRAFAAAMVLFWILIWIEPELLTRDVIDFELCFAWPDLVVIVGLLGSASYWLSAGDSRGRIASAAAGGALVYLGLLDVMFNLRHGQYTIAISRGIFNAIINSGCLLFGVGNIWFALGGLERQAKPPAPPALQNQ
jgi:hypothetical protein